MADNCLVQDVNGGKAVLKGVDLSRHLLRDAVDRLCDAFTGSAGTKFRDLSAQFWIAIGRLNWASRSWANTDEVALAKLVQSEHRTLGAPGDFGYCAEAGDALREVYDLTDRILFHARRLRLLRRGRRCVAGGLRPDGPDLVSRALTSR